jgi:hypothetical protein
MIGLFLGPTVRAVGYTLSDAGTNEARCRRQKAFEIAARIIRVTQR